MKHKTRKQIDREFSFNRANVRVEIRQRYIRNGWKDPPEGFIEEEVDAKMREWASGYTRDIEKWMEQLLEADEGMTKQVRAEGEALRKIAEQVGVPIPPIPPINFKMPPMPPMPPMPKYDFDIRPASAHIDVDEEWVWERKRKPKPDEAEDAPFEEGSGNYREPPRKVVREPVTPPAPWWKRAYDWVTRRLRRPRLRP